MQIIDALRDSSRRMVRELGLLQVRNECAGVSYAQGHALLELEKRGPLSVTDLADLLALDKSTASRTAGQLQSLGLVELREEPEDRRRKWVELKACGREKLVAIHAVARRQVSDALSYLEEEERDAVARGLELYARALTRSRTARESELRPLRAGDAPALRDIILRVSDEFGTGGPGGPTEDPELWDLHAAYSRPGAAYWVATRRSRVLGGGGVAPLRGGPPQTCELQKMYLLPEARGAGLGKQLLDRCLESARGWGYRRCYLETTLRMAAARRLYEGSGFLPFESSLGNTGHHQSECRYVREL